METATQRVGTRQLRQELAGYVARAAAGERIVVTIDGEAVAQLGPLDSGDRAPTLDDLIARGLLVAPSSPHRRPPTATMPTWAGTRLDHLVQSVRGR
jgi:antitoxin (DNA-binding transcriptional repressor) of toxin-antitoxin stability system